MMPASSRFAVAVHILALMAQTEDEPIKSDKIASSVKTNPVVIRRIICALADAKLVTSQTGANGGSRLARKSCEITLLDVYHAIEGGGVFALHRQSPSRNCIVGSNIKTVLGNVLEEVNLEVERVLAKTTIEQVLQIIQARARGLKRN
jgi:Rrf2 family protein